MPMDFDVNVKVRTTGADKVDELEKKINSLKTESIKVKVDVDKSSLSKLKLNTSGLKIKPTVDTSGIQQATAKMQSQFSAKKIQFKVDTGQTIADIAKIESKMKNLGSSSYIKSSEFQNAYNILEKFKNTKLDSSNIEQYNIALKTCQNYIQAASADLSTMATESQRITLKNSLQKTLKENSAYTKEAKDQLRLYIDEVEQLGSTMTKLDYTRISNGLKEVNSNMVSQGRTGKNWIEEMGRGMKVIGQFATTYGIIHRIPEYAMKAAKAVIEVDTAMTELRKVSNDSEDAQIGQYFDHATESAKKYGAAINEVINSAADWKRLGYSVQDAAKLSDATTLLRRVGDNMTQESSSQGLISILKGFNYQADQVNSVIDVINQIANTEPIDTAGIVSALQRSASSLSAAGNDLNQSVSMITAANSVLQDPDVVGTAMRTLSMRIRGAKTELEDAGLETEGMAESTAKLREEMIALSGVDIMQDNNTFKSTYAILDELADKWQGLSDIQQASVTELIAGKRQGAVMSALMSNWNIAEDTMKQAAGADGSAEKELGNYQKSIQYSLDKMKATAQEFANVTLDSSWLKACVDGAQTLLEILTKIEKFTGIIPLIFGGKAAVKAIKNFDRSNDFVLYGCESIVA